MKLAGEKAELLSQDVASVMRTLTNNDAWLRQDVMSSQVPRSSDANALISFNMIWRVTRKLWLVCYGRSLIWAGIHCLRFTRCVTAMRWLIWLMNWELQHILKLTAFSMNMQNASKPLGRKQIELLSGTGVQSGSAICTTCATRLCMPRAEHGQSGKIRTHTGCQEGVRLCAQQQSRDTRFRIIRAL